MQVFGIKAISVNASTLHAARSKGWDLYAGIRQCEWSMVFLSAKHLTSKDVNLILRDPVFHANLILLGIDGGHVLVLWSQDFWTAYRQISLLRQRLPERCALAVVTATLTERGLKSLCLELHLTPGSYHCI
jgi:superfamily II DNA helicase RecQ